MTGHWTGGLHNRRQKCYKEQEIPPLATMATKMEQMAITIQLPLPPMATHSMAPMVHLISIGEHWRHKYNSNGDNGANGENGAIGTTTNGDNGDRHWS